ncbi:MAG: hypothetical protein K2X93_21655 [Candidatus Obscuribacterales bacterium]|nr:hypothetical protein [Candidatus Obscuribacterales bacterium]
MRVELALALLSIALLGTPVNCAPASDSRLTPQQAKLDGTQKITSQQPKPSTQSPAQKTTGQMKVPSSSSRLPAGKSTEQAVKGKSTQANFDSSKKVSTTDSKSTIDKAADRYRKLNLPSTTLEKASRKSKQPRNMLIPPPPPTMPTYLNVPTTGFGDGFSVQFMSLDDLKFQLKNLEKKLTAANEDEQEQTRVAKEKEERAARFDQLFEEGVVSRRELEQSHVEAERAKRDLEQAHIKVEENTRLIAQVKDRISAQEPKNKQTKVAGKKGSQRKKGKRQTSAKSAPQDQISR